MRKVHSESRFAIDDLVDLAEPIDKLECTQNIRSIFHRVPSFGARLDAINKLTKSKNKYFFFLLIAIALVVVGALGARMAYKRSRQAKHMDLAKEVAAMATPLDLEAGSGSTSLAIVESLRAKDLGAFDMQLLSLRKNLDVQLSKFLIISDPEDLQIVSQHVSEASLKYPEFPFHIVDATSLVPELVFLSKHSESEDAPYYNDHKFGYITRMIVKLAAFEFVGGKSEFYLALDADVLCVRPTSYEDLVYEGKAVVNKGTISFDKMYQWKGAVDVLDGPFELLQDNVAYGGVPSLYNTRGVYKLKTYLEIEYQQPWRYSLLRYLFGWTDYSLYYSFLRMSGMFERYHTAKPQGVFRTTDLSEGTIGTKGWERWDFSETLDPKAQGAFVHLHGMLEVETEKVNEKLRRYFE